MLKVVVAGYAEPDSQRWSQIMDLPAEECGVLMLGKGNAISEGCWLEG